MNLPDSYRGTGLATAPPAGLPGDMLSGGRPDRLDIRGLIAIFRRRLALFASIIAACVLLALLVTVRTPRQYTATAEVVIKSRSGQVTPGPNADAVEVPQRAEEIETELELLGSREMAATVYDGLRLAEDPGFVAGIQQPRGIVATLRTLAGFPPPPDPAAVGAERLKERAIDRLSNGLRASRVGSAYALRIAFSAGDPERAARIANGYARLYSLGQVTNKQNENVQAIQILESRMEQLRAQAQADFGAVQRYRIANNLLSTGATSLTEGEVSAYNQQVAAARAEAAEDQTRLAVARGQLGAGVGRVSETSPVVQSLRSQRAALSTRVAELTGRYLDNHPELVSARRQLADIDAQIAGEVDRTLYALDAKARGSSQRLASLQGSLGAARGKLASNNNAMIALDDLERRSQASQALYESYLNRYKEAVARSGAEESDSRLLSAARVPGAPSSPNLPLNLTLGLLIGVLLGTGTALAVESAYSGLTTGDDVEQRLGIRYLGGVPLLSSVHSGSGDPLANLLERPGGVFAESFRNVLTTVRQSPNGRNQVLAISSALPGEGKSTFAAALARSGALGGERVVAIDCDFVRAGLTQAFGTSRQGKGLREVLREGEDFAGALVVDESGAAILPITTPFTAGERLTEKGALHRLIAKLRERFDLVILDCPPILPIAETREMLTLADNVVVVARWRKTSDQAIKSALKLLPPRSVDDIGAVLNGIDMRKRVRFGQGDSTYFYKQYKDYYTQAKPGAA